MIRSIRSILLILLAITAPVSAKEIARWDFEGTKPTDQLHIEGDPPRVLADPTRPGGKIMLATLRPGQERPERSELRSRIKMAIGDERWVSFRLMRPQEPLSGYASYFQLGPASGKNGVGSIFQLASYGNQWKLRGFLKGVGGTDIALPLGAVTFNEWETWGFHVRYRADKTGLIEVWRNGKLIASHSGTNMRAGDTAPVKWGVYVGKGNKPSREMRAMFDDVVVSDDPSR
jgi:Polysaccharide lyase